VEVKGDMVRLGIQAPRTVQVWRKELWEAIVAENIAAASEAGAPDMPEIPMIPTKAGVQDLWVKKKK
jgi:carbon storage regulator